MNRVKGILLMAGEGARFGGGLPKQFHPLGKKKVYQWTLDRFVSSGLFGEILLICPINWIQEIQDEVGDLARAIPGGKTRQESSYLGLLACSPDTEIVTIHDGVRPFVSERILLDNVEGARRYGAVDTCIPSADTLVYAPSGKTITSIPQRSEYLRGQTPQSFSYPLILKAHEVEKENPCATDDCQLVLKLGKKVHIVEGEADNMKITTLRDLQLAEARTRDAFHFQTK